MRLMGNDTRKAGPEAPLQIRSPEHEVCYRPACMTRAMQTRLRQPTKQMIEESRPSRK